MSNGEDTTSFTIEQLLSVKDEALEMLSKLPEDSQLYLDRDVFDKKTLITEVSDFENSDIGKLYLSNFIIAKNVINEEKLTP